MEISSLPSNVYHRLMLLNGAVFTANEPLPGAGKDAPKVFLIVFTPAKTDSSLLEADEEDKDEKDGDAPPPDGETSWTVPAKYKILMREPDGKIGELVQIHEVWADKVLLATRLTSKVAAVEEFTALLREELGDDATVDLQNLSRPNGQQQQATAAAL